MTGEAALDYWESQISKAHRFQARYAGFSEKRNRKYKQGGRGKKIRYMILENVVNEDGVVFRGHLWIPMGKRFRKMDLKTGTQVGFIAKVNRYTKIGTRRTFGGVWVYAIEDEKRIRVQLELKNISDFQPLDG